MRKVTVVACIVFAAATAVTALVADECTADFSVDLTSQEESVLHFEVMVSTDAERAEISYNLVLTLESEEGEEREVKVPRDVKIGEGSVTDVLSYTLAEGESLAGSDAELVSCRTLP